MLVGVIVLDSLFFISSKIIWILISPGSIALIWFLIGVYLLWKDKIAISRVFLSSLLFFLLMIAVFPIEDWLLYSLESQYAVNPRLDNVDGIIVLAGSEDAVLSSHWNQVVTGGATERNLTFIMLANKYPNANLVFSGGSGSLLEQEYKPADVAERLFMEQGIDVDRIVFERKSRNTSENIVFTKKIIKPKTSEQWVLITTGLHMPRSMGIACKENWAVTPYPVDFRINPDKLFSVGWDLSGSLSELEIGIKELIGLLVYRFSGKSC